MTDWEIAYAVVLFSFLIAGSGIALYAAWIGRRTLQKRHAEYEKAEHRFKQQMQRVSERLAKARRGEVK